jgi:hypothetical protein
MILASFTLKGCIFVPPTVLLRKIYFDKIFFLVSVLRHQKPSQNMSTSLGPGQRLNIKVSNRPLAPQFSQPPRLSKFSI